MKNFIFIAFLIPPSLADRRSYQVFLGVICHKTINYRYYNYFVVTYVSAPELDASQPNKEGQ